MNAANIELREVIDSDLALFFEHQRDPDARYMAAFTAGDPDDRVAFDAHWHRIRSDKSIILRAILAGGEIAGYVVFFDLFGDPAVAYWLGKSFWGRGIATRALKLFLEEIPTRPLYARAAKDNKGSIRVLGKCGFVIIGEDTGFAEARAAEIEELILRLDAV